MSEKNNLSPKRLAPIREVAGRRQDGAANALAEAQRALADREAQLRELENYKEPESSTQGAAMLRNRESFRLRLAEAIRYQRMAITEARKRVEAARATWIEERSRTKVLEKLIERGVAIEQKSEERRQQQALDELALRLLRGAERGRD